MVIKEEKLTSKDLNNYKYRVDYNTEYPGNFDDMINCAYNNANAICVKARFINPKTGKLYMNDSQFYIIKNKNDFKALEDCADKYGYNLFSPKEIDWNNCYTAYVLYPDKSGSYKVINNSEEYRNKKKTESYDGKRKLRIARYNEFDNGRVLFNYDRMTINDAEELAKQKSIKDPNDIYYVKFDDIMNPTTDICWYRGKSYPSDKIDMINGEVIIKENNMKLHIKESQGDPEWEEFLNNCQSAVAYKQIAKICKEHGYENISKAIYINNKGKIKNLNFHSDDYYMPEIYYNERGQVDSIDIKGAHNMTVEELQTLIDNYNNALEVINLISKVDFDKLYHYSGE
jgi:hypothetical protein